ncbi:MAG: ribbon-helix-helix domain-containing protein [Rhodospirillales bacterium]|nr:ribbon-helix-helix domain-containing protein [Rhodospirillales bacterium]
MKTGNRKDASNRARVRKRSVRIGGHNTSVSLEDAFWDALGEIARARRISLNALVATVDRQRRGNLSSALRLFVLESLRRRGG